MSPGLNAYVLVNFVVALLLAVGLLAAGKSLAGGEIAAGVLLVLWALLNIGGIFEHRRWAFPSELLRLPVTAVILAGRLPAGPWHSFAQVGLVVAIVANMLWLLKYRGQFDGKPQAVSRVIALPAPHAMAAVPTGIEPSPAFGENTV